MTLLSRFDAFIVFTNILWTKLEKDESAKTEKTYVNVKNSFLEKL